MVVRSTGGKHCTVTSVVIKACVINANIKDKAKILKTKTNAKVFQTYSRLRPRLKSKLSRPRPRTL